MTTYQYKILLDDCEYIALENIMNVLCKELKEKHNIDALDPISKEPRHVYGKILERMKESLSTMELLSYSTFSDLEAPKINIDKGE